MRAHGQNRLQGEQLRVAGQPSQRLPAVRQGDTLHLKWEGELHAVTRFDPIAACASHAHPGGLSAPMNGSVVQVLVAPGDQVEAGAALVLLEAMKMEHSIRAPHSGTVKAVYCSEGELVADGAVLVELEEGP